MEFANGLMQRNEDKMKSRRARRGKELPLPIVQRGQTFLRSHHVARALFLRAARVTFVREIVRITREGIDGVNVRLHGARHEPTHGEILIVRAGELRAGLVSVCNGLRIRGAFGLVRDHFGRHTLFNMKSPLLFQNQPAYLIEDGQNRVLVSPGHGARVLRWTRDGREIITWPETADWSQILKVRGGNPILFPFIARHFVDGKNELWRDATGTVRPMPQHGFARDATFSVIDGEAENSLRMSLVESDETRRFYPFAFRFDVVVSLLSGSRLEVRFETTNTGADPLPYYAGHHFYLAVPHQERADWTLHLPCAAWGRQSPDGAIVREEVEADIFGLDDDAAIDRFQIEPKSGNVTLLNRRTDKQLVFRLDHPGSVPWYAVTTWTQKADSDFYCVEPWLGLPNAIHHGQGLRWLEPGAREIATLVLDGGGW
jgi:galactose mutarotase-like enzyme